MRRMVNTVPPDTKRAMAAERVEKPGGVYLEWEHTEDNNMQFRGMQAMIAVT